MFWQKNKKFDFLTSVLRFLIFSENGSYILFVCLFFRSNDFHLISADAFYLLNRETYLGIFKEGNYPSRLKNKIANG